MLRLTKKVPLLFVTGCTSINKTEIVKQILDNFDQTLQNALYDINEDDMDFVNESKNPLNLGARKEALCNPLAWVNSTVAITPRILFENAHKDWTGEYTKYSDGISDFIENLQIMEPKIHRYLVLDNCHDIFKDYPKLTLNSLLQLSKLSGNSVTVVCISHLSWELITDYPNPPTVLLQSLMDEDAIELLAAECPDGEDAEFYLNYVKLVYMSFSHATRDTNEQRYLIKKLWPKYMEPIRNGTGLD